MQQCHNIGGVGVFPVALCIVRRWSSLHCANCKLKISVCLCNNVTILVVLESSQLHCALCIMRCCSSLHCANCKLNISVCVYTVRTCLCNNVTISVVLVFVPVALCIVRRWSSLHCANRLDPSAAGSRPTAQTARTFLPISPSLNNLVPVLGAIFHVSPQASVLDLIQIIAHTFVFQKPQLCLTLTESL